MKIISLKCENCGGELSFGENDTAVCKFCGSTYHVEKDEPERIIHHTVINNYGEAPRPETLSTRKKRTVWPFFLLLAAVLLIASQIMRPTRSQKISESESDGETTDTVPEAKEEALILEKAEELKILPSLTGIKHLTIKDATGFRDYSVLSSLPGLLSLTIEKADQLTDIGFVRNMNKLSSLSVSGSGVTDLSPLSNKLSLIRLELKDNPLHDFRPVETLSSLTVLKISPIKKEEIPDLSGLSLLEIKELNE